MEETNNLVCVGACCGECMNGIFQTMPEKITEDGTVILTRKCNDCGHTEKVRIEPMHSIRDTGIKKCEKCGYEYFYVSVVESLEEMVNELEPHCTCPNCDVSGYQFRLRESYGPLKHEHGNYKSHPITQKHRKGE